ncbi:MAG TPA: alpha-amylase, partial [Anaerolineaceae bacterium]|nr:alpha-amylase [Anaerolineaceae bacterium]
MEFHISRRVREKYGLDETLFAFNGSAIFLNLQAVKRFADKLNRQRDLIHFPENAVKVGQANALGLIDEIFHYVIHLYRQEKQLDIFDEINQTLETLIGSDRYTAFLVQFISEFPPQVVYDKHLTPEAYLAQTTDGKSNREDVLEELLLFWLENQNPALKPFKEIFEAPELTKNPNFEVAIHTIRQTFAESQKFGPDNQSLVDMLLSPSIAVPNSLSGQLEFIREKWASLLGSFLYRLLLGLDVLKEESRQGFGGPGPVEVPVYYKGNVFGTEEAEQFSADREWMPRLVLIAKNAFVWLDQLSKKYGYPIHHLDQIPEEELRTLADRGFTGLWLIGLWERSRASAKIKQLLGNPDAIASAYSLHSYEIASDLGGEEACRVLRDRAWAFGIRLASDMVPNHMAIDSDWVNHHPERFISLDQSPYPAYTFNGPDLSSDPGSVVQIEDHYYDRTDAAVVFRRIDKASGETRFIYHGNDGTSMPWNDTAQLNYLDPQVREAVIQTILEVARKFPIIRFDAAMTLAKKHYQRLWFPQPGTGGDIPSRAEHGMSQQQFDQAMPVEFWREVVDRVAREAPDTLLLAEAFWMMEGYFVRTLGMHRVYNSAFMNMLRNEDNTHYRQLLKNTLEFEPEILKRYVNFMNNPDERTAVDQFGKGDKYFGICVLMSTFPGLPMFGHGQVEGFTEKYGMEFRRAYIDEYPDGDLIRRHNLQIAPLLHRRELFAGVEHFWLFDFYLPGGAVDENVYAYTNAHGVDRTLVIYNNRLNQTDGWIHLSASQLMREGSQKKMNRTTLADQLIQDDHSGDYLIFRDQMSGLQFLRPCSQIKS